MTAEVGERRIRPGADPGEHEVVDVEEMRPCPCEHCVMGVHWHRIATMQRFKAQAMIDGHNRARERVKQ